MKQNVIAIDGPSGAGKSTVAKNVATALGFVYIDTGAMYRAVTHRVLASGVELTDSERISEIAASIQIKLLNKHGCLTVISDGADVTEEIRKPAVTAAVPVISQYPSVRRAMVRLQRQMASNGRAVLDGRDIGTVVIPDADTKVFLTASAAERARRRCNELSANGYSCDVDALQAEMLERDRCDSERDLSPLKQAEDAVLLDTTGMPVDKVVERVLEIHRSRCSYV